ncbi:hypothetical protein BKA65DRAFT_96967 [Rhexocercosporidium sp. MPI-PUGE-AT-0058]|nr:hypothetical protein BKA65DRAFT_96967 [Rhexocercosporidium sp. MPI-PUGE-AT-0058]
MAWYGITCIALHLSCGTHHPMPETFFIEFFCVVIFIFILVVFPFQYSLQAWWWYLVGTYERRDHPARSHWENSIQIAKLSIFEKASFHVHVRTSSSLRFFPSVNASMLPPYAAFLPSSQKKFCIPFVCLAGWYPFHFPSSPKKMHKRSIPEKKDKPKR